MNLFLLANQIATQCFVAHTRARAPNWSSGADLPAARYQNSF